MLRCLLAAVVVAIGFAAPSRAAEPHRLALQISDDDPVKMRAVLDVAANVSRHYSGQGEDVEIVVVAFNGGLDMLLDDRSPVKERLTNFLKSMPNVSFIACGNTLETLAVKEGRRPPLIEGVSITQVGVAVLMDLAEKSWTIVRP
ncbi:DsrE family protein [Bradyrhizobium sp. WYCCWR 13022]|uniref:DsrE family protein n=1 Tax=Bradyrhizobium sp. WYCCWR 13022 TaxID=3058854 RepID=UPI001FF06574|nr:MULTISPECIES: DsrE family protein [Bradyrhizobium]MDN4982992.1 DsrE family protein [Bradyrhizobium sp. WYCCWR 13022]